MYRIIATLLLLSACAPADSIPVEESFSPAAKSNHVVTIGSDPGGVITDRIDDIIALLESGSGVRIAGAYCYSSCTMYLKIPNSCISHGTVFGFHAPGNPHRPMSEHEFTQFSKLIGSYYNDDLRDWYMRVGRHKTSGLITMTGTEVAEFGYQICT